MKNFLLFILILSFSFLKTHYIFSQVYNEHSIILDKGQLNYLYKDCENRVEIIIPEIEGDYLGLLVVSADASIKQNEKKPYVFSVIANNHAEKITLEIYFYGNKITTKLFYLKSFPVPQVVLFSYRKDKIVESRISRLPSYVAIQFSLGTFEDDFLAHENNYKADYFEIKLYRKDKIIFSSKVREPVFSTDTSSPFWQLPQIGDYLTVKAVGVKRKTADGKVYKVRQLETLEIGFK